MKHYLQLTRTFLASFFLIATLIIAASRPASAQSQFTGWLATFQNYKLSPRFGLYFDIQYRTTDKWQQMNALLLRPGVNFY